MLEALRSSLPLIAPSLLACDFARLGDEIRRVEDAGAKLLHLDIMDGHFVPNLSFGIPIVEAVRRSTKLPLDVHLMISEPRRYVRPFRDAGADMLTIHIEVEPDPTSLLQEIRAMGAAAGLSLNPPTDVTALEPFLDLCDLILVMSVMPGFGGQKFDERALTKLSRLDQLAGSRLLLSVDGGVNSQTIGRCAAAGATLFVTGTALFEANDYKKRMTEFVSAAKNNKQH